MHQSLLATLGALLLLGGSTALAEPVQHEHAMAQPAPASQPAENQITHTGVGILKAINLKDGKVQIAHEAIATLQWPPMTMWFALRAPLPAQVKVGDHVRFELKQIDGKTWDITKIEPK